MQVYSTCHIKPVSKIHRAALYRLSSKCLQVLVITFLSFTQLLSQSHALDTRRFLEAARQGSPTGKVTLPKSTQVELDPSVTFQQHLPQRWTASMTTQTGVFANLFNIHLLRSGVA